MARTIELQKQKEIVIIEKQSITCDKISIDSVTDNGISVTCIISFFSETGNTKSLILWDGQDYIDIGQWTDEDVNNRIIEILN